jgi:riboflavin kinase/FMN adenylyltransferase
MSVRIEGVVVIGDRRGRELGFPTANVAVPATTALPPDGVYAGSVERSDGTVHLAAISVGRRPQYYEAGERLVEAHLLDFSGDLYGERIAVVVGRLVRGQIRFASEAELVDQMGRDVEAVRAHRC